MKETGILFKDRLVRAILNDEKTHTRRIITPQPVQLGIPGSGFDVGSPDWIPQNSPYGMPGDWLYVRETWAAGKFFDERSPRLIRDVEGLPPTPIYYRADERCEWWCDAGMTTADKNAAASIIERGRWRPSIHMPKKFSRIWLRLTELRVERIQDISVVDIVAEGVNVQYESDEHYRSHFRTLWDSINLSRGYGWKANPLVWVLGFKKENR